MKFDHKHRPQTLNEIIFASADVKQVLQEYGQNRREKHLLLHGPKGTGKSVVAQLVIAQRLGEVLYASWGGANNAKSYQMKHDNLEPDLKLVE